MLFQGNYAIPSGLSTLLRVKIVKLTYVLHKGVIQETTHCEGEYVSSDFICPKKDSIYMLIKSKSLNEHVQYHYEMDQYSAIC